MLNLKYEKLNTYKRIFIEHYFISCYIILYIFNMNQYIYIYTLKYMRKSKNKEKERNNIIFVDNLSTKMICLLHIYAKLGNLNLSKRF